MGGTARHRGFGFVRRLPSKRWQASYVGPDLARHAAPSTFTSKADAEGWLGAERVFVSADSWVPPRRVGGTRSRQRSRPSLASG